jgi:hypothetical protein
MSEVVQLWDGRHVPGRLPSGSFTSDDLAAVGVSPEQFDRYQDWARDQDVAEWEAEQRAKRDATDSVSARLTAEEARSIVDDAAELTQHMRGCEESVCGTCCDQESDAAEDWWEFDVPAARQRLAQAPPETTLEPPRAEFGSGGSRIERDEGDRLPEFAAPADRARSDAALGEESARSRAGVVSTTGPDPWRPPAAEPADRGGVLRRTDVALAEADEAIRRSDAALAESEQAAAVDQERTDRIVRWHAEDTAAQAEAGREVDR